MDSLGSRELEVFDLSFFLDLCRLSHLLLLQLSAAFCQHPSTVKISILAPEAFASHTSL